MSDRVAAHVRIRGRVQGVCFRWETQRAAMQNNVYGWVRNRADGSVEALFEGDRAAVEATVAWCRQGPAASRVDNVEVVWEDDSSEFRSFEITR